MGNIVAFHANGFEASGAQHDLEQVGGKGLSLVTMARAGMPVPPGFVLTVRFFEPWIAALVVSPEWAALQNSDASDLVGPAEALQARCAGLAFSEGQKAELKAALDALREANGGTLYAVRSSSPEEDLDAASFAGGYETTLGVTRDGIEAAVRTSFASAFDTRVFLYKREHGIPWDRPWIAVIVQQLVHATSAGVAFSLNPLNNCYDEAVINANHGLGDSVVSGTITPDVFVVDKLARRVIATQIGGKEVVITANGDGGTSRTSRARHDEPAITAAEVMRTLDLLSQVEAYYRKPVDIEWAFAGEHLYLLQARPITTYLPLPDEMVTAPGDPKHLYANSTLIEQGVQEPLSVLGTDFLGYVLKQVGGSIGTKAVGPGGMTFTAGGRYYMDISYALKLGMGKAALAPGSFGDPRVMAILDGIDMKQYLSVELPPQLKSSRGKMLFTMSHMAKGVLEAYLRPAHILRRYQAALPEENRRLETFSGEGVSLKEQAVKLSELLRFFYGDYGIPMILAAQAAQVRIKRLFKQEVAQAQDHLVNLGIALPGSKTTEMGGLMYELARSAEISQYDTGAAFVAALERGEAAPEFVRRWEHLMAEFGMRCPGEIDPATPRPKEQPAVFFDQLKNMALSGTGWEDGRSFFEEARAKREAAYQALRAIALQGGKRKARALEKYYEIWLTFGGYRETPKHYVIKVIDLFRRQALAIGRTFVADGRLDRPDQIFDLTIADIDRARRDPALDLRALGRERSELTRRIRKSHLVARVIDSRGKIYYPPQARAAGDGALTGVPISPGVARGRIKVLHSAKEKQLLPGEILVARVTDPGWTPLFINAAGIVLEIGGALQHGAVVAREYGIPCVSSLDNATTLLKDGQFVEVDGSNGVVRILKQA
jgi:rifampicin phosphotransferase